MMLGALDAASHGLLVFPIEPQSKKPYVKDWKRLATSDPEKVKQRRKRWWADCPDANLAIATGNGFGVLDIDPRHGGGISLAQFEAEYGPLPSTATVRTGGGGT
jgi:hypothetical protein